MFGDFTLTELLGEDDDLTAVLDFAFLELPVTTFDSKAVADTKANTVEKINMI